MRSVAIVGGGVVGTSVAYHLREADADVTLYEKGALGAETTAASMAIFMWGRDHPADEDLRPRAWEEYGSLIEDGTLSFRRTGSIHVAETEAYLEALADTAADLRALGRAAELLSPGEVAEHGLEPSSVAGGLYTPDEGFLEADEVVEFYVQEAHEAGVAVEVGGTVTDVLTRDGAVEGVEVNGESRDADVVVNAAGPWAPRVNALAGVELPLRHTRGPILAIEGDEPTSMPFARFERQTYARPFGEGGLYVGHYETDFESATAVDPDEPRALDDGFRRAADDTIETFLPRFAGAREVDEWVGLRTVTPDGRPMVGETAVEGFLAAVGMTGQGVTMAPVAGQLLAERVETGGVPAWGASLSPARFSE